MERLTQKVDYDYENQYGANNFKCDDMKMLQKVYDRLGQLEDVEEELGIDLLTLYKASAEGVYIINDRHDIELVKFVNIMFKERSIESYNFYFQFKDYGKTWALTKEELK